MDKKSKSAEKDKYYNKNSIEVRTLGAVFIAISFATFYVICRAIFLTDASFDISDAPTLAYFTVQTGALSTVWMVFLSFYLLTKKKIYKIAINTHVAAVITTYTLVTGIIFWFVLVPSYFNSDEIRLFTPMNMWLHTAVPIYSLIALNYVRSINKTMDLKPKLLVMMIYPVLYITFTVLYSISGTYLYPMLNPELVGGWVGVGICMTATCVFIAVLYLVVLHQIRNSYQDD